jgi:transposase
MKKVVNLGTGEVNLTRPKRRRFSVDYKLKILAEAEACSNSAQVAAMLRREGLYYSSLHTWREARALGGLNALEPTKAGPKAKGKHPLEGRVKALEKEKRLLERRLKRAELLLEIQKKASELMGMTLDPQFQDDESE